MKAIALKFSIYTARQFLSSIAVTFLVFTVLVILIDFIELLRRTSSKEVPATVLLQMIILHYPLTLQRIGVFIIFIASIISLTKLTRSNELVIARSAGISAWQFLAPIVLVAFLFGLLFTSILNPISCTMLSRFEFLEGKYMHGRTSTLAVSSSGLWLRQKNFIDSSNDAAGEIVIHALDTGPEDIELYDVTIFFFDTNDKFLRRIDANKARLVTDFWHLQNVLLTTRAEIAVRQDEYFLETDLTFEQIHDSLAAPETISFWELPGFIKTLKEAGFSPLRHQMQWHKLLAQPFFYSSMVLIAAIFSLTPTRRGKTGLLITASIMTGFLIYFLTNLVSTFGISGAIPVTLTAWIPVSLALLAGMVGILHLEDG